MKPSSPQYAKGGSNPSLAALSKKLIGAFEKQLQSHEGPRSDFTDLISEFHQLEVPEADKLRQKDKDLVNLLAVFAREVRRLFQEGKISEAEFILFLSIVALFDQVESILWELKRLPGEPPKPDPLPEPPPGPLPGGDMT